jgi:hypothetical protein
LRHHLFLLVTTLERFGEPRALDGSVLTLYLCDEHSYILVDGCELMATAG